MNSGAASGSASQSSHPASPLGLSASEAAARLTNEGPNEFRAEDKPGLVRILRDILSEPMLALLLLGGLIYFALGDTFEALILLAFATMSVAILIVQESRSERALAALRDLASPRALVVRDGKRLRIPGREVVCGDLVLLHEGDRVPADGWLSSNQGIHIDESLLTGESVPVRKAGTQVPPPRGARPGGGDDLPFVWAGTLVVRGSGTCIVMATGPRSELGRIGKSLATLETEAPRLRQQTRQLVLWFFVFGALASLLVTVLYATLRGSWLEAALGGIALGMSLLPEEFPVVLTVFLAMGAMRLSRAGVLTRRAAAIETLGSATVLCTDKTGTLTENRMRIAGLRLHDGRELSLDGEGAAIEPDFRRLVDFGALASAEQPVDPMDIAFHQLSADQRTDARAPPVGEDWSLHRHYPLRPDLLAMSQVWSGAADAPERVVASKGAPEAIAELCGMTAAEKAALSGQVDAMAERGLRVLAVAEAKWSARPLPDDHREFAFRFLGLVGLADPLRATVPEAIRECREAGIRVIMITGDYPQTAREIARQAGIDAGTVMTGAELAALDDATLAQRIAIASVFARIMPEQKLRLVEALKAQGEIVAMTGDGVNDAPSLKAAHIGIAMGQRGTDVAREASAIVLLNDDFGSIVAAIRLGRRIYDNLRKAIGFIVAVHIPVAGLALLPLLTGMPLLLLPIHIAFIEMIVDPVCSIAFEAEEEEAGLMKRPPRPADAKLLSAVLLRRSVIQGLIVLAAACAAIWFSWARWADADTARTIAFFTLALGILGLILANRVFGSSLAHSLASPNRALAVVVAAVVGILGVTQLSPPVAAIFSFVTLPPLALAIVLGAGIATMIALQALKPYWREQMLQ